MTSAGCAAGLDLCIHIVRKDFGAAVANAVARRLAIQPHRDGGQAQYIEAPVSVDPDDDRLARSMAWALEHLDEPLTVQTLAQTAHMSTRTYLRHFAKCTGTSPIRWLIAQRIQASLSLLETTDAPVDEVAARCGRPSQIDGSSASTTGTRHPCGLPSGAGCRGCGYRCRRAVR